MPTIGIDQVQREIVRPKWYSDLGYGVGNYQRETADAIRDAILAAMTGGAYKSGQVPTTPTPSNPSQLTFPSGATTRTSPLEMEQLQQMGGVPSRQGQIVPFGQPNTGGVSYTQPTRLGMRPDLDYQTKQAQLQKAQQDLDPNSPVNQYIRSLTAANQPQRQPSGEGFAASLSTLRQQADAGDEQAVTKLRLILQLLQEP